MQLRHNGLRIVNHTGAGFHGVPGLHKMKAVKLLLLGCCLLAVFGCANRKPPPGRWEGTYDAADVMVAVRLEIVRDGSVYLSAPDAFDFPVPNHGQRAAMHERLATGLNATWGEAEPRRFDFDGHTFRKPGGIAPQMEWDPASGQMTVIIYLERRPGIRIPLRAVKTFNSNPWAS